jgi:Beta-galactosidase trimerisation domain.
MPMRWWVGVLLLMTTSFLTAQPTMPDWWLAADGLRDPDDLPLYRQIGLTVLWVSVPYRPDGDLSGYDRLLDTADQLGMPYIIALDLRPPAMRPPIRCAPHDVNYLLWLRRWLDIAIPYFRNRPNLLGYALGQRVDEAISYDDEGFALFLRQKYGTLERLQQAWQLPVRDWRIAQLTAMQADDELSPLRYSRPSLDVALYHWTTLRNLLVLWAEEVRRRDPERMLIAGPLTTYRSLAVVPPGYQAIVPFLSPEGSERDWLTHNCHAVAIARRGGRFRALPMLTVRSQDGRIVTEEALLRWAVAALAQGASGFVLNDWSALKESEPLRLSVMALRHRLKAEVPPDATPRPKTAVLYTPFAEGVLSPEGFPLYGFAIPPRNTQALPLRLGINEPATLFAWLRFHGWGIVDCLTPEELTPEFLGKYRTLLAPMPAYLDEGMQRNLATFVANGGIFVADFGTGAFQAEIPFQTLPTGLRELLGVWAMQQVLANMELRAEMTVLFPHPLFPDLPEGTHLGDLENSFGADHGVCVGVSSGALGGKPDDATRTPIHPSGKATACPTWSAHFCGHLHQPLRARLRHFCDDPFVGALDAPNGRLRPLPRRFTRTLCVGDGHSQRFPPACLDERGGQRHLGDQSDGAGTASFRPIANPHFLRLQRRDGATDSGLACGGRSDACLTPQRLGLFATCRRSQRARFGASGAIDAPKSAVASGRSQTDDRCPSHNWRPLPPQCPQPQSHHRHATRQSGTHCPARPLGFRAHRRCAHSVRRHRHASGKVTRKTLRRIAGLKSNAPYTRNALSRFIRFQRRAA